MQLAKGIAILAVLGLAGSAMARPVINFDTDALGNAIADGTVISNQYAAWGATFVPNILNDPTNSPPDGTGSGSWATNTDMLASTDAGFGWDPSMGNVLHSFDGWFAEDGDPNFGIFFSSPLLSLSINFIGDSDGFTQVATFDSLGNLILVKGLVGGSETGESLSFTAAELTGVSTIAGILPGYFGDWVGIESISFQLVPGPGAVALLGLGGLVAGRRRRA